MASDNQTENRRHFTRIPMDSSVRLACDGREWNTQLLDISLRGALLEEPAGYQPAASGDCQLVCTLSDTNISIKMEGAIVHHEEGKLGLRCDSIDLDSISHLKRMVELNLGNEALLERELGELIGA